MPSSPPDALPVFMFGMERSGTTLLSMMVGAHPDVAVPLATTGIWFDFYDRLDQYGGMRSAQDTERLVDAVLENERVKLWRCELDRSRILGAVEAGDFGSVVAAFHAEYARAQGKTRWANMDIATLDSMHVVNRWFPDARFLHIVRDGRDVALSNQTMPYGPGNIAECATAWERRITLSLRMGDLLGPERYLAFRYESLIAQPRETLERICAFLGLGFSEDMLAYADTVDNRVPADKQWLWPELKSPPQVSKIDRWRREMSENQRIVFEGIAGSTLREMGYDAYDRLPRRISAHLLELAYFLGRGGRINRLLRRLGIRRRTALERGAGRERGSSSNA